MSDNPASQTGAVPRKNKGGVFGCVTIFVGLVVVFIAYVVATTPQFTSYVLFSLDHFQGKFGEQPPLYHCSLNRFNAVTDYSKLVIEPKDPSKVSEPPTIEWKDYTPQKMKELSDNYRLPVVIKRMFTDSQAGKTWTHEWFSKNYGQQTIIYHELRYPITHITSSFQRQETPTTLGEYVQNVTNGEFLMLGNDHYMMLDHPELIEQLELNRWGEFDEMPVLPLSLRMFMGGRDTGVGWHAATSHNLFIEVKGRKLFKWFPPQSTSLHNLHPTLSNKLPAVEHCEGHYYSPDLKTYETVLEDGDACFTPAWVWHATRHLEPTIAVGLRMESFLHDLRSAPFQSFLAEFSNDIPGMPFFNAFTRGVLQGLGVRIQGQALSVDEKEHGYKWDWLRDYMQAGGKLASEDLKGTQWKL